MTAIHEITPKPSRMTRQREIIIEELRRLKTHPTADELYQIVRRRMPRISLGTVYRNLDLLCDQGLVRKLEIGGTQRRYDGGMHPHHHAKCVRCGRVVDLPEASVQPVEIRVDASLGFAVTDYELKIFGVCVDCAKAGATTLSTTS